MEEVNRVYETNDYTVFKSIDGNRNLNRLHIARLIKSFSEQYLFSPILVNNDMAVIDGQHRLEAAKQLNLPIRYIQCNGYGLKEIHRLNTNMANWKKSDYLQGYCELKYPEYLKFRNFMRRYPDFQIASAEAILTQHLGGDGQVIYNSDIRYSSGKPDKQSAFERGTLKIPDYDKSCLIADDILLLKPFYDGFNRRLFVISVMGLLKNDNFTVTEFIRKLSYMPSALVHCTTVMQYKLLIEEIYNYKRREKINLRY